MGETAVELKVEQSLLRRDTRRLLGITVLLTQLPLMWHMPLWLSLPGMLLVLLKTVPTFDDRTSIPPYFMTPMVLVAALGILVHYGHFFARDPCVAFLFLLVGFKYSESGKNYDASLLIVLCAFLLLTQFFYWQSIVAALFTIPPVFFIGLCLFSLQRGSSLVEPREMVHITATLFLQSIPVAMLLFVAIPRLSTTDWGNTGGDQSITGLSSRMAPGSIAELSKSNEVAFRVEFDGQAPSPYERYWRGPVLNGFDGAEWYILPSATTNYYSPAQPKSTLPDRVINYTVTTEPTDNPWILVLDTPASLPIETNKAGTATQLARINNERQLNATKPLHTAVRYNASSLLTDRFTPALLPNAASLLTTESNPETRSFAAGMRKKFPDDNVLANQLLMWFNKEPFFYTLSPPVLKKNSIDDFLFSSRKGFCEHYAGSFVFVLRAAGIPARVVTGYQGGEFNGSYMIVRQSDAHAWSEAFINGQWRRFDPTSAVAPERVERGFQAALGGELNNWSILKMPWVSTAFLKWDAVNYAWQQFFIGFDVDSQSAMWQKLGLSKPKGWMIAVLLLGAACIWMTLILYPLSRMRGRRSSPCERQWTNFCQRFAASGAARALGESPTDYVHRLSKQWPQHRRSLNTVLEHYQLGQFSAGGQNKASHSHYANTMRQALQRIGKPYPV